MIAVQLAIEAGGVNEGINVFCREGSFFRIGRGYTDGVVFDDDSAHRDLGFDRLGDVLILLDDGEPGGAREFSNSAWCRPWCITFW